MRVAPEGNEATTALALLKGLPLKGATVTGDAAFCRRALCKAICDGGGEYPFAVKVNQPGSMADIAASFGDAFPPVPNAAPGNAVADPPPDVEYAETVEKGHGRFEIRRLAAPREAAQRLDWPGAAQVCRIERIRERAGEKPGREVSVS